MDHVLLVTNPKGSAERAKRVIEASGFHIWIATNPRRALALARRHAPDVVIVDASVQDWGARQFLHGLHRLLDVPLIALVRNEAEAEELRATATLVSPFTDEQLLACVRRVLRTHPRELVSGPLRLDLRTRRVYAPHLPEGAALTPKLFALLATLMRHPGEVVDRDTLMHHVWNLAEEEEDRRTLDVHVCWVRQRIEPDPSQPTYLHTVRGEGYRIAY